MRSIHCYLSVYCLFTKPDPRVKPSPEQEFDKRKSLWKGRDVFEEVREKRGGIPLFLQKSFPSLPNAFLYFANGSNTVKMAPPPGFRA